VKRPTRVELELRHVIDRDGVVHKFIWNVTSDKPTMLAARCRKPVASRSKYLRYVDLPVTCILCIDDSWDPS